MEKTEMMKMLDGVKLSELKHIKEVSYYNHNVYIFGNNLIKAISSDDNTTDVYLKFHVLEINKPKIQKTAVVEYCSKRGKFHTGTPEICFDFASDFYIIGNIHDNPDLMKEITK